MHSALCFRRARDQVGHAIHRRLQNVAHQIGHVRIAGCFRVKIDDKCRDNLRRVFATMGGKQNLKRLEQIRSLSGALQDLLNFLFMPIGHCRNDRILVFEIAINEADADPSLSADVMHAGLVKPSLGEAHQRRVKNLGGPIEAMVYLGLSHEA